MWVELLVQDRLEDKVFQSIIIDLVVGLFELLAIVQNLVDSQFDMFLV
jgi:hypothetical protein